MTNREAIEVIKLAQAEVEWEYPMDYAAAFDMAISALQAQEAKHSTESSLTQKALDTISRTTAIDVLKGLPTWWADEGGYYGGAQPPMVALLDPEDAVSAIENLPSAQLESCGDAVSRQYILDAFAEYIEEYKEVDEKGNHDPKWCAMQEAEMVVKEAPSAQPDRKTGRWLIRKGISDAQCSECGMYFNDVYDMENSDAFCRHCGTKMEGLKVVKRGWFNQQTGGD